MPAKPTPFTKALKVPMQVGEAIGHTPANVVQPIVCPECCRSLPPGEFTRLPSDNRCDECVRDDNARREAKRIEADLITASEELLDAVAVINDAPTMNEVVGAIIGRFPRGLSEFADRYYENLTKLLDDRPGSPAALRALENFTKFISSAERNRTERDIASMTDEQLREERRVEMFKMFADGGMREDLQRRMLIMLCEKQGIDPSNLVPTLSTPNAGEDHASE